MKKKMSKAKSKSVVKAKVKPLLPTLNKVPKDPDFEKIRNSKK